MNKDLIIHIQSPPKEASYVQLVNYFSHFGLVVSLKFFNGDHLKNNQKKKVPGKSSNNKSDETERISTSTPNSALLECYCKKMKQAILGDVHFFEGKAIRVRSYMDEDELIDHIELVRDTRMFISGIPQKFTNSDLATFFGNFGAVKSAYITKEISKNRERLGYVIFAEKGVLETLNSSGIVIDSAHTLAWSSYYHKNQKSNAQSNTVRPQINAKSNATVQKKDLPKQATAVKPKPVLLQHQMQLKILNQINQQIVSFAEKAQPKKNQN